MTIMGLQIWQQYLSWDMAISRLQSGEFEKPFSISGNFKSVKDDLWVYGHSFQVNCSSVTFDQFKHFVKLKNISYSSKLFHSCKKDDHLMLEPFL